LDLCPRSRTEEFLRLISTGLRVDPESVALHNLAGWRLHRLNDLEKAKEESAITE